MRRVFFILDAKFERFLSGLLEVYQAIRHSRGYAGIFYLLSLLISDLASIL